jgi:hypothetical protein
VSGGRAAPWLPSADLPSLYELAAIVDRHPGEIPNPESRKLPVRLQFRPSCSSAMLFAMA